MKGDQLDIPDEVYRRVFQEDADGQRILDELVRKFYDVPGYRPSFVQKDENGKATHVQVRTAEDAIFADGGREVIRYIMSRAGTSTEGG